MLNTTKLLKNANQNDNEIFPFTLVQKGHHLSLQITNIGEGMEKDYTAGKTGILV